MTIPTISTLPTAPARTDPPATFITRADAFLAALVTMQSELNTSIGAMNTDIAGVNADATAAANSAASAIAAANFKGNWSDLTGALDIPAAVAHSGGVWVLLEDLPDVTASEPSGANTDWQNLPVIPNQSGQSGNFLTTDGSVTSWAELSTDPSLATLSKTFIADESATMTLSSAISAGAPVVSATKEIPQTGVSNNKWIVDAEKENYALEDSAYDATLGFLPDISYSYYTNDFEFGAQETAPSTMAFADNGSRLYIAGDVNREIYQYSLTVPFDVSTASYDSISFDFSSQDTAIKGLFFKPDGSKFYIGGDATNTVYQYSMSSAFDISTASYDSVSLSVPTMKDLKLNPDGTKMFLLGSSSTLREYALSTAYDISSGTLTDDFSMSGQDGDAQGIDFNSDGTLMIMAGYATDDVYLYSFATGFDITSASYTGQSLAITTSNAFQKVLFNDDLSSFYLLDDQQDEIDQYAMVIASFSLSSGSFASGDIGKTIKANGGTFLLRNTDGLFIEQESPTSYDAVSSGNWTMSSLAFDGDSIKLSEIDQPYDMLSATYSTLKTIDAVNPEDISWGDSGNKLFVMDSQNDRVAQHTASTAYSLASVNGSAAAVLNVGSQESAPTSFDFNSDGTKCFVLGTSGDRIRQYSLTAPWSINAGSYDSVFYDVSAQASTPECFRFNNDGSKFFVLNGDEMIYEYETIDYSMTAASYSGRSFFLGGVDETCFGFTFNNDGTELFVAGDLTNQVHKWKLSTAFDISTLSYSGEKVQISAYETQIRGLGFSADGKTMVFTGVASDNAIEFNTYFSAKQTGDYSAITKQSIDTEYWIDINSMTAVETKNDGDVYYAISTDSRDTWIIRENSNGQRTIVRNNAGTWEYNSNVSYVNETWTSASENNEFTALSEASSVSANQMDKAQVEALTDANQFVLTSSLDFATVLSSSTGDSPVFENLDMNYDANIINQNAVQGTDYEFDFPASDKVRITAINAGNYKVRVV